MIKFYLKIQNNMLTKNLLYMVTFLVLSLNLVIRIWPRRFIIIQGLNRDYANIKVIPTKIYTYCDVYLLLLFIILIFFFLGIDFKNSMEEISIAIGGSKTNKFMARKLGSMLIMYFALYVISFVNIYTLYIKLIVGKGQLLPLKEIVFYSLSANIFVISISLFILFLSKDIAISTTIITSYYLIEEFLWRCKVTQKKGILGHLYQYFDYGKGELFKAKLIYILLSVLLLFATYKLSKRKSY
ncbi:hypothetical protein [Clostridium amazonitimonense]|uniref:hypothetical protein n=1 Tax=Clostridium amazonitimonense TaxID=1499689 RepID=UPI00068C5A07|nr:hypothetical protein [Clostridium amazonitimonense]